MSFLLTLFVEKNQSLCMLDPEASKKKGFKMYRFMGLILTVLFLFLSTYHSALLYAKRCDVALIDWSPEYHCISRLNFESKFHQIPFNGLNTSKYSDTILKIKRVISKLPKWCREELPAEYTYGPFLALSKYKRNSILITSINEIEKKINNHLRSNRCNEINMLSLIGHGAEGSISLGAGIEYDNYGEISTENIYLWATQFRKFSGKVHKVQLVGCKTGKGAKGLKLVKTLSRILSCQVAAPTKEVSSAQNIFDLSFRERSTSVNF